MFVNRVGRHFFNREYSMSNVNSKQTSAQLASVAAEVLQDTEASKIARRLAGSVLSQAGTANQTGAEMEQLAGRVLGSPKYSELTKGFAASLVSQANKER